MERCSNCGLSREPQTDDNKEETRCRPCVKLAEGTPSVQVAPLESDDLELVLAWRSHPRIHSHFRQQDGHFDWEEHVSWFESRDEDRYDFVINFDGRRVGVVNIDTTDEVGIFLGDFSAHGQGVATAALRWVCHRFTDRAPLFAEIHNKNESSKRLFKRCGFHQYECDGEWKQYRYEP